MSHTRRALAVVRCKIDQVDGIAVVCLIEVVLLNHLYHLSFSDM